MSIPRTLVASSLLLLVRVAFSLTGAETQTLPASDGVISVQQVEPLFSFSCADLNTIEIDYQIRSAVLSETSIPTHKSGIFNMLISVSSAANEFDDIGVPVNVEIGCSDPKRIDYMECILNCEKWGLRW
jgi:hypothetical protein